MNKPRDPRRSYLSLSPVAARALSALALVSLHGWFLLKFLLVDPLPALQVTAGLLGLVGMISAVVVFLCRYNFQAHAAQKDIDERELIQRNAAYFRTHQYMVVAALVGFLIMEFWERTTGLSISTAQMGNFLTVLFFCGLILPASILAWQDRGVRDSDDDFEQRTA